MTSVFNAAAGLAGAASAPVAGIAQTLDLPRGSLALTAGYRATPYMLISGALRLDRRDAAEGAPVLLALPGDLIGVEGLQGDRKSVV